MNTNTGFVLRKKGSEAHPLYWMVTGGMTRGRFVKDKGKAALFKTWKGADVFRACFKLEAEVVHA